METNPSSSIAQMLADCLELAEKLQVGAMFEAAAKRGDVTALMFEHYQRMEHRLKELQKENERLTRETEHYRNAYGQAADEKWALMEQLADLKTKVILRWP